MVMPLLTAALLRVTADHRLYIWGHPSNRKLGHVGFNHDGTEATGGQGPGGQGPGGQGSVAGCILKDREGYSHSNIL